MTDAERCTMIQMQLDEMTAAYGAASSVAHTMREERDRYRGLLQEAIGIFNVLYGAHYLTTAREMSERLTKELEKP